MIATEKQVRIAAQMYGMRDSGRRLAMRPMHTERSDMGGMASMREDMQGVRWHRAQACRDNSSTDRRAILRVVRSSVRAARSAGMNSPPPRASRKFRK